MNFRELLEQGHSKQITSIIINEVLQNPKKMDLLMNTFIQGPFRITQRAAWSISFIVQKKPELIHNYL